MPDIISIASINIYLILLLLSFRNSVSTYDELMNVLIPSPWLLPFFCIFHSLFLYTEISSYLFSIALNFSFGYFQTSFKNTQRFLGNDRIGNFKHLFLHKNKNFFSCKIVKIRFIRTQRFTATKWNLNKKVT